MLSWLVAFPFAAHSALSVLWGVIMALFDLANLVYQGLVQLLNSPISPWLQLSCFSATHFVAICGSQPQASWGISCIFDLELAAERLSNLLLAPSVLPYPTLIPDLLRHPLLCYGFSGLVGD